MGTVSSADNGFLETGWKQGILLSLGLKASENGQRRNTQNEAGSHCIKDVWVSFVSAAISESFFNKVFKNLVKLQEKSFCKAAANPEREGESETDRHIDSHTVNDDLYDTLLVLTIFIILKNCQLVICC